ncbi:RNA polymerase sigma factor [Rapidithrix thailandica]|uniref:RNA polymerase sigma factor n=1 Tax=Rapidithrix thailandica TaxID=413964 RepID=A0AAW9SB83_9BACT
MPKSKAEDFDHQKVQRNFTVFRNPRNEMYAGLSDSEIWSEFKQGSEKAYRYLYDKHVDALYNYATHLTANHEAAEECIQDLFVELWCKRHNLGDIQHIRAYLLKSLRRKLFRQLSQDRKKLSQDPAIDGYAFEAVLSHEQQLIRHQTALEHKEKLQEAFNKLPDRQREALYLRFYNNLSCSEIAQTMDMNSQSVYNLIHRALKHLRKILLVVLVLISFLRQ